MTSAAQKHAEVVGALEHALKFGIDPSLEPIRTLCAQLGNPHDAYRCVQVAGSNGKSSTTRITAALLRAAGYKVGLYTSPHLVHYPERMEIDGRVVDDARFDDAIEAALDAAQACSIQATEFELLTAGALWLFAEEGVDWAVLECGLGGRWDATSVASPQVAVITGVALEHTQILGDTLEKIAAEKAAIIKPGAAAVLAQGVPTRTVFESRAAQVGARIVDVERDAFRPFAASIAHMPYYQRSNTSTALVATREALGFLPDEAALAAALETVVVPGRFEFLRNDPPFIIDAAHNPQSAQVLARELRRRFPALAKTDEERQGLQDVEPALLIGVLADKDARGVVEALCPLFSRIVACASSSSRALPPHDLAAIIEDATGRTPELAASVADAVELLHDVATVATGSITVAGEVKSIWC